MTKSEIEKLIEYIDNKIEKRVLEEFPGIYHRAVICSVNDLYDLLREYPVEPEKTCGPNYQGMYEVCEAELEKANAHIQSLQFDMHNMAIDHAHYVGAVAAMETIFGRQFNPER